MRLCPQVVGAPTTNVCLRNLDKTFLVVTQRRWVGAEEHASMPYRGHVRSGVNLERGPLLQWFASRQDYCHEKLKGRARGPRFADLVW
jgi:hypothetical protein